MDILLIDDHSMAIEFYYRFLNEYFSSERNLAVSKAYNCEQAYNLLAGERSLPALDLVFLDYRLPPFDEKGMCNGIDVAGLVRGNYPNCKIVMITGHTEPLIVYDIIWTTRAEAIAAKCDIDFDSLEVLLKSLQDGEYFKSKTIAQCALKVLEEKVLTDTVNRKIISLIMQGYKVKDIYKLVSLKPSTIHRRLLNIKTALKVPEDTNIVRELIRQGYLTSLFST